MHGTAYVAMAAERDAVDREGALPSGFGGRVEALLGGIQGGHCPARQVEQPQEAEERPQPELCIP